MSNASPAAETDAATSRFAAVVYPSRLKQRDALAEFVRVLQKDGVRIGGILQESFIMEDGEMRAIDGIDIETGNRFPINRPTRENWDNKACSLNTSALAETSAALRRAIEGRPDLIVIEKFGASEKNGEGISDEIFQVIVEDIPLLIAVPEGLLDEWQERSGGMGDEVAHQTDALLAWWKTVRP